MIKDFQSVFASYLNEYLAERKSLGYKYDNHRRILSQFDSFCWEHDWDQIEMTEELAKSFIYGESGQSNGTIHQRDLVLSSFAEYLYSFGIPVYRFEMRTQAPKYSGFVPHIFTDDELHRLFGVIDHQKPEKNSSKHMVDPVLFRLLLGSGLRISEALGLKVSDFHYEESYVVLRHTKNDKERLVPIARSVSERIKTLISETEYQDVRENRMIFAPLGRGHYRVKSIERHFKDYLILSGIPHTDKGPRVHDLRHTFCVRCFHRWSEQGMDLENLVPYLSAYLGHSDFSGTQMYLHLTAEIYPDILDKVEDTLARFYREEGVSDE